MSCIFSAKWRFQTPATRKRVFIVKTLTCSPLCKKPTWKIIDMALIFKNSICPLCNKLLGENIVAFPRMIENPADELLFADDAVFHRICLERHG